MRAALVGCGGIAPMHVSAIRRANVELAAVCDRDHQRAGQLATEGGSAQIFTDFDAMLADVRPDVVHILTPPASHAELAIKAADSGVHAVVEKPVALSVADADAMIAAARRNGVYVIAHHNYLFKPSVKRARALVESGEIGDAVHVEAYYGLSGEGGHYTSGGGGHWAYHLPGGVFTNFLPHLVYLEDVFLGGITAVTGVAVGRGTGGQPARELTVVVEGATGTGSMTVSMRAQPYAKYVRVFGTAGIVHADLVSEVTTLHRPRRVPRLLSKALFNMEEVPQLVAGTVANSVKVATGAMRNMPDVHAFVARVYAALEAGEPPPTSGEDGRTVVRVMEQVWERMPPDPGRRPVRRVCPGPRTPAERRLVDSAAVQGGVLVTGAAGYLGRHVAAALARCGIPVRAFVRDASRIPAELEGVVEAMAGNIADPAAVARAMEGVERVVHCAAVTTNHVPWEIHEQTNIDGTRHVIESARDAHARRVVHVSSVIVYGLRAPAGIPLAESAPVAVRTASDRWAYYLRSKLEAERLALADGTGPRTEVTVVRPGIIYGPGAESPLRRGFLQLGAVRLTIGRGRNRLPLVYVDNLVDGILLALTAPQAAGEAYNLVDEPQIPIRETARCASTVTGDRTRLLPLPPVVMRSVAAALERRWEAADRGTPPRLTRFNVQSGVRDIRYDVDKARRELGWEPFVALDEGLRRTLLPRDG